MPRRAESRLLTKLHRPANLRSMCNRYANRVSYRGYVDELSDTRLPLVVPGPEHAPNLEPRDNIRPTDRGHVLLPVEGGLELREMRWGLIPWFHRSRSRNGRC